MYFADFANSCQFTYTAERRVGNAFGRKRYQENGLLELASNALIITKERLHQPYLRIAVFTAPIHVKRKHYPSK